MSILESIIAQVHVNDLTGEASRIKVEQEERRLVRLAQNPNSMNASELMQKLAEDIEDKIMLPSEAEKAEEASTPTAREEKPDGTRAPPRFPPPPVGGARRQ